MDHLESIATALSAEHRKEFVQYLHQLPSRQKRKDVELFQLLTEPKSSRKNTVQIQTALYGKTANAAAYHTLRQRLLQKLAGFLVLKMRENDPFATVWVTESLAVSRYLFEQGVEKTAWAMLRKAEKIAQIHEQYDLLNTIYHFQLEKSDSDYADDLQEIIRKRNTNKPLCDEEERTIIALALITDQLNKAKQAGHTPDFEAIIQDILQQNQLQEVATQRPTMLYKLVMIARSTVVVRKEYHTFEPYVIQQYEQMQQNNRFAPRHQFIQLQLLYIIAQTLFRTRKFQQSLAYLAQLKANLIPSQQRAYQQFYPKYVLLSAANNIYDNRREEAIAALEDLLESQRNQLTIKDALNAQMNLAFYYFQQENYSKASRLLLTIPHSDQWCQKKMGKEWVLKKNLSEVIIQYEFGNIDLVLNKIRSIESQFTRLLQGSRNLRSYLEFVKQLVENPEKLTPQQFNFRINATFEFLPVEQENLQAMHFYAWLKAKMLQQNYYDVLLELVHTE